MSSLFYKLFPTPTLLYVPHVGLDISDDMIRVIQFESQGSYTKITIVGERPLAKGVVDAGYITNEQVLSTELTALVRQYPFTHALVSLPEEKMYVFTVDVNGTTDQEIRSSIEFHLEENVPIPPAQAVFEYQPIEWRGNICTKATVTVFPQKTVDAYLATVERAGIKVVGFLSQPQAIVASVVPKESPHAILVAHISPTKTSVMIVVDRVIRFSSTISIGGDSVTEAIKKSFNLSGSNSTAEAENLKQHLHVDVKKGKEVFAAAMTTFSAIKDEVQKVYTYWQTHSNDSMGITEIILSGSDVTLPGFDMYISSNIKVPTQIANVWVNTGVHLPVHELEFSKALAYPSAIGLALSSETTS